MSSTSIFISASFKSLKLEIHSRRSALRSALLCKLASLASPASFTFSNLEMQRLPERLVTNFSSLNPELLLLNLLLN